MKIYRRPFYKTNTMVILVAMLITFVVLLPVIVKHFYIALGNGIPINYLIKISIPFLIILSLLVIFIAVYNSFYIAMSSNGIAIINGIIPFIKKNYGFDDMIKCEIGNKGGLSFNYFRVTDSNNIKSLPFVIDMIAKEDYKSIINDLRAQGVEIEIVGSLK
jgi:hypothetical protein